MFIDYFSKGKPMVVTFTGHRPNKIQDPYLDQSLLIRAFTINNIDFKSDKFKVGGCPGFDTLALDLLIKGGVPLEHIELYVPFIGFEKYAGKDHQEENDRTLKFNKNLVNKGLKIKLLLKNAI
jgi:hypothetical protein